MFCWLTWKVPPQLLRHPSFLKQILKCHLMMQWHFPPYQPEHCFSRLRFIIYSTRVDRVFNRWHTFDVSHQLQTSTKRCNDPASRVYFPNIAKILYSYNWDVGKIIFVKYFSNKVKYFYWWNNNFTTFKILTEIWLLCLWFYSPAWNIFHLQLVIRKDSI